MNNPSKKNQHQHQPGFPKAPELLAPAGSFETCRAVIFAGADAVYAGGSRFGARAYAENFTQEELLSAIDFVHLYGKKLYLTVNTLLKQNEIEALYEYLLPYYLQGLDAVIVQDFGVMQLIHTCFPDLPIHISTQMSVASAYGFAYLKKRGAVRIVTARELSLEEIRTIRSRSDLEIECFVHGALCYCYSGQCLLSSMLGGRSGNRGRCAQPCRLPYTVLDENRRVKRPDISNQYRAKTQGVECFPLSPKDLSAIDQIPQLIEAGITSFKIEGRMKSAEYAAGVTAVYRKYIDQYMEQGYVKVSRQDQERLLHTGNRSGFTNGYYSRHNGPDMITMMHPGHEKSKAADLQFLHEKKIPVQAEAFFVIGEPARLSVSSGTASVSVQHGLTQAAKKQPMSREMIVKQLSKTGSTSFVMDQMTVHMDQAVFLPKQAFNQLRREALEQLTEQMLLSYRRTVSDTAGKSCAEHLAQGHQRPDAAAADFAETGFTESPAFTAAVEEKQQLHAVLEHDFISRVYLDSAMYRQEHFTAQLKEHTDCIHAAGKQAYLMLPPIFRSKTAQFYKEHWQDLQRTGIDGYLVKTMDELGFLEQMQADPECCVTDHSLYTYSDYAKAGYAADGWCFDTIPLELNRKELRARKNAESELMIYGHMPLMTSAQCIKKTFGHCTGRNGLWYLKDRYAKEFPVKNICSSCYNTIYNPQPLSLIQLADELEQLHPAAYRLWFTIESEEMVHRVLNCTQAAFLEHQAPDMAAVLGAYTNGHYKRGTE